MVFSFILLNFADEKIKHYFDMKELIQIAKGAAKNSLYVLLILALIQPFGIDSMQQGRIPFLLTLSVGSFACVVIAMLLSNMLMRNTINQESMGRSIVHILLFFIINTPLLGAILLTILSWFLAGNPLQYWYMKGGTFNLEAWGTTTLYVSCISVIVAIIVIYQLRNDKLRQRLDEVEQMNRLLEQRQERIAEEDNKGKMDERDSNKTNTFEELKGNKEDIVEFIGQGQKSHLLVAPYNIIYVESMANYADICYIADNEIHHSTLRITLKQVKEGLASCENIIQCHRAFLVNLNFIQKITDRNSGYQLQLFGLEKQIPVSRANESVIKQKLK